MKKRSTRRKLRAASRLQVAVGNKPIPEDAPHSFGTTYRRVRVHGHVASKRIKRIEVGPLNSDNDPVAIN